MKESVSVCNIAKSSPKGRETRRKGKDKQSADSHKNPARCRVERVASGVHAHNIKKAAQYFIPFPLFSCKISSWCCLLS